MGSVYFFRLARCLWLWNWPNDETRKMGTTMAMRSRAAGSLEKEGARIVPRALLE